MARNDLTAQRVREVFDYSPKTGLLTWRRATARRLALGLVAGGIDRQGYRSVGLSFRPKEHFQYFVHRLIWLHVYGSWPAGEVDHLNGIRTDNRLANLRDVGREINSQNRRAARSDSSVGMLGVRPAPRSNRWVARIKKDGILRHIGVFDTPEEAHEAYLTAKRQLHEGCTI